MITKNQHTLVSFFNQLKEMRYKNIPGVVRIESNNPGPAVGITACTHGNEPSGLAVFEYLLEKLNIEKTLLRGTLYLVINNIRATEKYFNVRINENSHTSRYCDVNMNRLPKDVLSITDSKYELARARELYPIWTHFTHGLDIHSTLEPSKPIIISRGERLHSDLIRGFPIETIISNIDTIQIGIPAFSFYGGIGSDTKSFAIESGQHTDPHSFEYAIACATSLLKNLDMLPNKQRNISREYEEYHIHDSLIFPDISFDFVRGFRSYEEIHRGDLLARNQAGEEIRATIDGHIIFPTSQRREDKDISEEVAFVSGPIIRRYI